MPCVLGAFEAGVFRVLGAVVCVEGSACVSTIYADMCVGFVVGALTGAVDGFEEKLGWHTAYLSRLLVVRLDESVGAFVLRLLAAFLRVHELV